MNLTRRQFTYLSLLGLGGLSLMSLQKLFNLPKTPKMPILFLGHGSPMNAIEDNPYSQAWQSLGAKLPTPQAILVISAHWESSGTFIQSSPRPKQIYDFHGFPKELYEVKYQPPGSTEFAKKTSEFIPNSLESTDWGLDHGAWSVLVRLFPKALTPTFQLSINKNLSPQEHFNLAKNLNKLREHGVLILGSGNIVHNLQKINWSPNARPHDWSLELDEKIKGLVLQKKFDDVSNLIKTDSSLMNISHPTLEHFIPLLYVLGASKGEDKVKIVVEGIDLGSISMTSFLID